MFDSRKETPNCNFAEEIVSYIYDEMKTSEKADFETHIAKCSPCANDIAAFSNVSFSIKDWRDEEFATLKTPQIVIPYESPKMPTDIVQAVETNNSWFDRLGGLFNFSPAFFKTATAFGAIAIVIGLGWFLLNTTSNKNNTVAENDIQEKQGKTVETNNSNVADEPEEVIAKTNSDDVEPLEVNKDLNKIVAVNTPKPVSNKNTVVKIKNTPIKKVRKKNFNANKSIKSVPIKKESNLNPKDQINKEIQEIPNLIEFAIDDTEDADLRLTDLFEEDESGD